VNSVKLEKYCERLAEKEFKSSKKGLGKEKIRVFSAVSNKGVYSFADSAKKICGRIYIINDDFGAVSGTILQAVKNHALSAGYNIISSYCPLNPFGTPEHIFVPELSLGFVTSNVHHDFTNSIDAYRIVNYRRFTDNDKLKTCKKRLRFNLKAKTQMINRSVELLAEAKTTHDKLEKFYISATNFSKVEELTQKAITEIDKMYNNNICRL